jgi:hypothetical protein
MKAILFGVIATAAIAGAQSIPRNAAMVGGGSQFAGQCTVEVVVDGVAEVEIRGASATLRNLGGQPPQWRRYECTAPLPGNVANFRFEGVDGRGRQSLVRDPRNGGVAVVRIEDPDGGQEGYTFRLSWGGGQPVPQQDRGPIARNDDRRFDGDRDRADNYYRDRTTYFAGNDWRAQFFQGVRADLDHATSGVFPFTGDRARLQRTQMELDELQQKLGRGFYDERELDEVMASMQNVLQANRMSAQDRDTLSDDLNRMRDFRVRHDDFGARDQEGPYHRDRDQYFRGNDWRAMFFARIREDVEHVSSSSFPFSGDQARVQRTLMELDELQQKLSRGFYDERELDQAMGAMQMVLQNNRLVGRDRDVLTDDLSRMRDFRVRHDEYGAR